MLIYTYTLSGERLDVLNTEIFYNIASAKSLGYDLLMLEIQNENIINKTLRALRRAKQEGIIQLYAMSTDFEKETTETNYLLNKFPLFCETLEKNKNLFAILKL